ncbi:glutaminase A [Mycoplasma sp. P36-A1]|uniref:glutaminase A n=1 Tax=Mycoplasma sp. P36-A1 TaxID=3252900 RepID=UPI003C2B48BD
MEDIKKKIESIYNDCTKLIGSGEVADYIPELGKADPNQLGFYMVNGKEEDVKIGQYDVAFSMQSISKVIIFICAIIERTSEEVLSKVTLEPTSSSFNSIVNLELKNDNRPLNPFINAGAIVTTSLLSGKDANEKVDQVLSLIRKMAQNDSISYNKSVYMSEKETGARNRALAYYMQSTGVLQDDIEEVLDAYFKICSIEISCRDLAKIGFVIANDGYIKETEEQLFTPEIARIVRTVMALCGMYDASGTFAVNVGLPSKSGVGGGIMSVSTKMNGIGIGVFSPELDIRGNSVCGQYMLERVSKLLDLSIF